jgi:hypothetical protein
MKEAILSVIRHLLGIAGAYAVGKGYLSEHVVAELVVGIVSFTGLIWGATDEFRASKKAEIARD